MQESGAVQPGKVHSLWTSPRYNHCIFTARPDFDDRLGAKWTKALLAMDYKEPRWRPIMELEGLTKWVAGRKKGYEKVFEALKV